MSAVSESVMVSSRVPHTHPILRALVFLGAAALLAAGCARVPVAQQRRISQPALVFSDSPVAAHQPNLTGQIEPGTAVSGGAQAAGCTTCR